MADGRRRDAWRHTATLMAHWANLNRVDPNDPVFSPDDFDPFLAKPEPAPIEVGVEVLKTIFIDGGWPAELG